MPSIPSPSCKCSTEVVMPSAGLRPFSSPSAPGALWAAGTWQVGRIWRGLHCFEARHVWCLVTASSLFIMIKNGVYKNEACQRLDYYEELTTL